MCSLPLDGERRGLHERVERLGVHASGGVALSLVGQVIALVQSALKCRTGAYADELDNELDNRPDCLPHRL
jgi:hypothetical protein